MAFIITSKCPAGGNPTYIYQSYSTNKSLRCFSLLYFDKPLCQLYKLRSLYLHTFIAFNGVLYHMIGSHGLQKHMWKNIDQHVRTWRQHAVFASSPRFWYQLVQEPPSRSNAEDPVSGVETAAKGKSITDSNKVGYIVRKFRSKYS